MIYTVTLNPSVDYTVWVSDFAAGKLNRTQKERIYPGGKGINVSVVLKNLGHDSRALGFTAGFTGAEIENMINKFGCKNDFIRVKDGFSRINMKIKSSSESEINGMGPVVNQDELNAFFAKLDALKAGDVLVLSGSVPSSLPQDIYEKILERIGDKDILCVVDASGKALLNSLKYRPFLIKPNNFELAEIVGESPDTQEKLLFGAQSLQQMGARNVLVSMAGEGAMLVTQDGRVFSSKPPEGKVINSVGAGDSMVAGFIAGYLESSDYAHAFKLGLCAGSATAFDEWLAQKEDILKLYNNLD